MREPDTAKVTGSRRVAVNTAAIALSTMLSRGIQFGWVLILGRLLIPADFGVYGTIGGMIATAAVIPEFGIGVLVLRDVPQMAERAGRFLSATLVIQPVLALLGMTLLIGAGLLLPYDTPTRLLLGFASISLLLDALGNIYYSQLIAAEHMVETSIIAILHIFALVAFVFTVLARGGGLPGLYLGTILASLIRWMMHWGAARRVGIRAEWPLDRIIARRLLSHGWPIMVGNFLKMLYQHVDKIIVLAALGEAEAGYLTAAFVLVFGVTELLNTTILVAFFPMMSRMAKEDLRRLRRFVDKLALGTLLVALPIVTAISLLAPRLSALLFPGFLGTASVLSVMIWHTIPVMMGNLYGQLLVIEHRQLTVLIVRGFSLGLNILINLILLPRIGVPGAAIAALISELIALILLFIARLLERSASSHTEPGHS